MKKQGRRLAHLPADFDRGAFWRYCIYASLGSQQRARHANLPYAIDAHFLDRLLIDQEYRCAVSGLLLTNPSGANPRGPYGPSLDRIIPALGYVPGNVRIVCHMVNCALNNWGEEPLWALMDSGRGRSKEESDLIHEVSFLRASLEVAYDGLLNHHLHDDTTRDEYTRKVGAALTDKARKRVAFGSVS